jgi:osmotically-inducible protein OsmY
MPTEAGDKASVIYIYDKEAEMTSSSVKRCVARVGFAAAVLLGVIACATGPKPTAAQQAADRATAERVQSALNAEKLLYARHIFVRAENGTVTLTGFVWDPPDLDLAASIAGTVEGVVRVDNKLELQRNGIDDSGVAR